MDIIKPVELRVPDHVIEMLRETLEAAENGTLAAVVFTALVQTNIQNDISVRHWWNRRGNMNEAIGEASRLHQYIVREADGLNEGPTA